jgi:hypothetical protein
MIQSSVLQKVAVYCFFPLDRKQEFGRFILSIEIVQAALLTNSIQCTGFATVLVAEFKILLKTCNVVYLYCCKRHTT